MQALIMEKKLRAYTLFSSSSGNCSYVQYGSDRLLIDAGASAKAINEALLSLDTELSKINGIFISHEHGDHTRGLQTISKRYGIPIYTSAKCMDYIALSHPDAEKQLIEVEGGDRVHIGDVSVSIYPTPHDSVRSFCYRIQAGSTELGYATDIGHISDAVQDAVFGCDAVLIESNHDIEMLENGPYNQALKRRILGKKGHLSNDSCACLAPVLARCGTGSIVLAHLSETNNTPEKAYTASRNKLREYGVSIAGETFAADLRLAVAQPKGVVQII